ncbi:MULTISPECIES: pseudouridine synthase [Trueperella]|uniref:Pseudouridine synthase n=1 Tax=Trueperella bernardiae TaxID=59561 RepID=A0A0W1KMP1_9ACTO|nr:MULTISPECIES: pseudouridine synthase [Trueperella]KTF05011.1 Ribosomal large subunit pseudouridine synthase B [Trueperella bernardiae]MCM3906614.1 rRNA pseudouridine synthase [Trueperella bernardiae]MDK8601116.1 pseudouridine synthase [Trueperella bernardiae]MDV6237948.1 pseudouridine synthase [Trueperella bernardiae]OCW60924.1 MFS transporter [Trueperella bernardiae]
MTRTQDLHDSSGERLQKVLAHAGIGSRRACEELITQGRVTVNGYVVQQLGIRVRPDAIIHVDGNRVQLDETKVTLVCYKERGVVSTMSDDQGRSTLADYIEDRTERLYHVGRLDADTEGIILLTNDGELAHRLTHPSYEVPKTYVARVEGTVPRGLTKVLEKGITLDDGPVKVDRFVLREAGKKHSIVELTLHSGRNHIVRRIMDEVGFPVIDLVRTQFANITIGRLKPGQVRQVAGTELGALMSMVDL